MKKRTDYHEGKTGSLLKIVLAMIKSDPRLIDDYDRLRATLVANVPALGKRQDCWNCQASMKEYVYHFDCWNALLLLRMANVVRQRQLKGMPFTLANQVRIPELDATHAVKCRTTQTAKLGLITQLRSSGTGGRVAGVWVITRRGWEALAGKPVPAKVKVWRASIEEHFDESTTLGDALRSHVDAVEKAIKKGKDVREDHRETVRAYEPSAWYEWSVHEGALAL